MNFCYIAPQNCLQLLNNFSHHLLLAPIVKQNSVYKNYYLSKSSTDYLILDNGTFENGYPMEVDEYLDLAQELNVSCVVSPDYRNDNWRKTYQAFFDFYDAMCKKFGYKKFDIMFVPQSPYNDKEGWIKCYCLASQIKNIDFIGIPNVATTELYKEQIEKEILTSSMSRINLIAELLNKNIYAHDKKHHILGLLSYHEIPILLNMVNNIYSWDSSLPVWAGLNNLILGTEYFEKNYGYQKFVKPVNFNLLTDLSSKHKLSIYSNIQFIQNLIN